MAVEVTDKPGSAVRGSVGSMLVRGKDPEVELKRNEQ